MVVLGARFVQAGYLQAGRGCLVFQPRCRDFFCLNSTFCLDTLFFSQPAGRGLVRLEEIVRWGLREGLNLQRQERPGWWFSFFVGPS